MKNQIPKVSSHEPSGKKDKAKPGVDTAELSDETLSQVSGGTGASLATACATGKHIPEVKL